MIDTLIYREAVREDARALATFAREIFIRTFGHTYSPEDLQAYVLEVYDVAEQAHAIADVQQYHLLVEDDAGIAAFLKARPCALPIDTGAERAFELCRLYVHARCQRMGIGGKLVEMGMDIARARGYNTVYLGVWEKNPPALALYTKYGFTQAGEYGFRVGKQVDRELILRLKL